jgi:hypothetical protein
VQAWSARKNDEDKDDEDDEDVRRRCRRCPSKDLLELIVLLDGVVILFGGRAAVWEAKGG